MSEQTRDERQRRRLSAEAAKGLPARVFAVTTFTGEKVMVKRGEVGYFTEWSADVSWEALRNAQTDEETDAALAGSMFGWHVPAAKAAMP
jgi:hypothetical protein